MKQRENQFTCSMGMNEITSNGEREREIALLDLLLLKLYYCVRGNSCTKHTSPFGAREEIEKKFWVQRRAYSQNTQKEIERWQIIGQKREREREAYYCDQSQFKLIRGRNESRPKGSAKQPKEQSEMES